MLEQGDQTRLSQPLTLCVKGQGMMGQVVELMNKKGVQSQSVALLISVKILLVNCYYCEIHLKLATPPQVVSRIYNPFFPPFLYMGCEWEMKLVLAVSPLNIVLAGPN